MNYQTLKKLLFKLDPEQAHALAQHALSMVPHRVAKHWQNKLPCCPVKVFGLSFPNPVGLSAGFEKYGDHCDALFGIGFGFIELGGVTPKAQAGNPKPRLHRIPEASALINRMGFNNLGVEHLVKHLPDERLPGVIGVNIAKNRDTPLEDAADDYRFCIEKVYPHVDYVTINISSPNTAGLRDLQSQQYLDNLLESLKQQRLELEQQHGKRLPMLVKVAPELSQAELEKMVELFLNHGIDGVIATNTSTQRYSAAGLPHTDKPGGLSGKPLFERSVQAVKMLSAISEGKLPIIAVGGIFSPEDAVTMLKSGASLIQVYTGFIYRGPGLIRQMVRELCKHSNPSHEART